MPSLDFRPADEADAAFIVDSWVSSYRNAYAAGMVSMHDWRPVMSSQVKRVLSRPGVQVIVACHPTEQDGATDLYGWIAFERDYQIPRRTSTVRNGRRLHTTEMVSADEPLVHYVFVKQPYRRMGIARGLFSAAGIDPAKPFRYTCKTAMVRKLAGQIPGSEWAPLIARFDK